MVAYVCAEVTLNDYTIFTDTVKTWASSLSIALRLDLLVSETCTESTETADTTGNNIA